MAYGEETNGLSRLLGVLPGYEALDGRFDELLSSRGAFQGAWERLLTGLLPDDPDFDLFSDEDVRERWSLANKRLAEVVGSQGDGDVRRNAVVDPIPIIFPAGDWSNLARGISQRARLLNHLLKDIYGPQRLLKQGLIPPELVYGHDGFLHAMRGSIASDRPMLSLYAAQLCRDQRGNWLVMADRTQGPSGGGYAVENRIALSGVLSTEFREMLVHRSAPFFATLRDSMNRNAVYCGNDASSMVLLSPGIHSSAYFEDAYLARYLGYTIAQAEDLTVRGGCVYIKTLSGLKRVSNILRRVPDIDCDPLELSPQSSGVPGLCQAARDRQVSIENQLGSGWAEQPALLALLPSLCGELLGEELLLPSVKTYWCGNRDDLAFVIDHLDSMVVRSAFVKERERDVPLPVAMLAAAKREELVRQLKQTPWKFVASPPNEMSTTPCWLESDIVAWPFVLRVFATALDDDFQVLPSGIARVGPSSDRLTDSLNSGTMSKDVWILGDSPVPMTSLRQPPQMSMEVRRTSFDLPSRVAEQMHWLGRWTARSEGIVRHVRFCANRLASERDVETLPAVAQVIAAIEHESLGETTQLTPRKFHEFLCDRLIKICFHAGDSSLLPNALLGVVRNASCLRDRLSRDSWLILSRMEIGSVVDTEVPGFVDVAPALNQLLNHLTAFNGLVADSMTRGPGWHFLEIGRQIEKLYYQAQLMESLLVPVQPNTIPVLEALLDIMDSSITYRYRYLMHVETEPVLDLLLLDQANPRSMLFQFIKLDEHLEALDPIDQEGISEQRSNVQECQSLLQLIEPRDLTFTTGIRKTKTSDKPEQAYEIRHELARRMQATSNTLTSLSEYLSRRFFTHTSAVQLGAVTKR